MADPDNLQSFNNFVSDIEAGGHRVGEHHVQEILHVTVLLLRVYDRQAHGGPVSVGGKSWHFCYQLYGKLLAIVGVEQIVVVVHESRESTHNAYHDSHGMGWGFESFVEINDELIDHHFPHNNSLKLGELGSRGKAAIEEQIAGLHIVGVIGQILYPIPSVHELSLFAIDVGDVRDAAGGAHETRVIG